MPFRSTEPLPAYSTWTDPLRKIQADRDEINALRAEVDRLTYGICSCLVHSRDGRVNNPLLVRLLMGQAMPWQEQS